MEILSIVFQVLGVIFILLLLPISKGFRKGLDLKQFKDLDLSIKIVFYENTIQYRVETLDRKHTTFSISADHAISKCLEKIHKAQQNVKEENPTQSGNL